MKIGIVGLGYFSDDFVRLFNIHPDVEEVVVAISCVVVASAESFFEGLHPAKAKMIEHVKNKYNIFFIVNSFLWMGLISFCDK